MSILQKLYSLSITLSLFCKDLVKWKRETNNWRYFKNCVEDMELWRQEYTKRNYLIVFYRGQWRNFQIWKSYGGCPNDIFWMSSSYAEPGKACPLEQRSTKQYLYCPKATQCNFELGEYTNDTTFNIMH